MSNFNNESGLRFGVIAAQSLDPDVVHELFYGPGAEDITYTNALNETRAEAIRNWEHYVEEAEIAAAEVDNGMPEDEREKFIESKLLEMSGHDNRDEFVDYVVMEFSQNFECDCSTYEGVYEGISYAITHLGGAPIVYSFDGPTGYVNSLCSPCVPGAADLDSGFRLMTETFDENEGGFIAHCVPRSWLAKEGN